MAVIAIGDIHGNLRALDDLLRQVTPEVGRDDTIVFLGDYIDRGPDSRGCIERILDLQRTCDAKVVALLGNHKQWLLQTWRDYTRHSWILGMEAVPTIQSYAPDAAARLLEQIDKLGARIILDHLRLPYELFFEAVPQRHFTFWSSLKPFFRTAEAVCAHGGLLPDGGPVETQETEHLLWGASGFPDGHRGEDRIVYGHWDNAVLDKRGLAAPSDRGTYLRLGHNRTWCTDRTSTARWRGLPEQALAVNHLIY